MRSFLGRIVFSFLDQYRVPMSGFMSMPMTTILTLKRKKERGDILDSFSLQSL